MNRWLTRFLSTVAVTLAFTVTAHASAVLKMDLEDLTNRADRVFRGTVISIEPGTVQVGGGEIATITYEFVVSDYFKGNFDESKGAAIARLTMLDSSKQTVSSGNAVRFSALPEMPSFNKGEEYVLFTTRPSAAGLSSTVGVDQGAFKVGDLTDTGTETVANRLNNAGIHEGPMPYAELAKAIRQLVAKQGGRK